MLNSRPPDQYLVAKGTLTCLAPNEYDRNVYGECNYIGTRTLIKCKQVRRKDYLSGNFGQCELHAKFREALKRSFEREKVRPEKNGTKKLKYDKVLIGKNCVIDEDPALMPCDDWTSANVSDHVHSDANCDDIVSSIRSSDACTDKEMLRSRINILKTEIEHLTMFRDMRNEKILRDAEKILQPTKSNPKVVKLEGELLKRHQTHTLKSRKNSTQNGKRLRSLKERTELLPIRKSCRHGRFGHSIEFEVRSLMDDLLSAAESNSNVTPPDKQCDAPALPGMIFCGKHRWQSIDTFAMFAKCELCNNIVLAEPAEGVNTTNLCPVHRKVADISASLGKNDPPVPTRHVSIDSESDDDTNSIDELLRSSSETSSHISTHHVNRPLFNRRPMFTTKQSAGVILSSYGTSASQASSMQAASMSKSRTKKPRDEHTCRAARCRPFLPAEFPEKPNAAASTSSGTVRPLPNAVGTPMRQPGRASLPFNPPHLMQRSLSGMGPIPHRAAPVARQVSISTTGGPNPQISKPVTQIAVPARVHQRFVNSTGQPPAHVTARFTQRDALVQRRQIEEDQNAANSILIDDPRDEEEFVQQDSKPSSPGPQTTHPTTAHRYAMPANRAPIRPRARIGPPTVNRPESAGPIPPSIIPGFGASISRPRPGPGDPRNPASRFYAPPGYQQRSGPVPAKFNERGTMQPVGQQQSGAPHRSMPTTSSGALDLSRLPADVKDMAVRDVIKMQQPPFQGAGDASSSGASSLRPATSAESSSAAMEPMRSTPRMGPLTMSIGQPRSMNRTPIVVRKGEMPPLQPSSVPLLDGRWRVAPPPLPKQNAPHRIVKNAALPSAPPLLKRIDESGPSALPSNDDDQRRLILRTKIEPSSLAPAHRRLPSATVRLRIPTLECAPSTSKETPAEPQEKKPTPDDKTKGTPQKEQRQGQRRSGRLDKSLSVSDESKDPLSMLADVSAAVRGGAKEEDEFEEEL